MKIGVIGFQGSVSEHAAMLKKAKAEPKIVKSLEDLKEVSGLVIPGGESTVIAKFIREKGLEREISKLPVFGTCAGAIILAKVIAGEKKGIENPVPLIDMTIERNAYGRQRESFEDEISIKGFSKPFHAVFIRAPKIVSTGKEVEVLGEHEGSPVLVRQGRALASTFHPELTKDIRVHRYFVEEVCAE
jgi:5'-phosphate synthase pdxT subunit